jgi:hypothetical protein
LVLPTADVRLWCYLKHLLNTSIITTTPGGLANVSDKTNELDWLSTVFMSNKLKLGAVIPPHNVPWSFTGKQETVAAMFPGYLNAHGLVLKPSETNAKCKGVFTTVDRIRGDQLGPNFGTYRRRLSTKTEDAAPEDQRYVGFDGCPGVDSQNPLWLITNQYAIGGLPLDGRDLLDFDGPNCELVWLDDMDWCHPNKVTLFATEDIPADTELFCERGNQMYNTAVRKRATFVKNKKSGAHTHITACIHVMTILSSAFIISPSHSLFTPSQSPTNTQMHTHSQHPVKNRTRMRNPPNSQSQTHSSWTNLNSKRTMRKRRKRRKRERRRRKRERKWQ